MSDPNYLPCALCGEPNTPAHHALHDEIERLREVIEEQNDTIKDLDQALAALEADDE